MHARMQKYHVLCWLYRHIYGVDRNIQKQTDAREKDTYIYLTYRQI